MNPISLRFDLRVPDFAKTSFSAQHRAMLEMATWGDQVGVGMIALSEHHGDPAGFSSAPLTLAAAVLARTERVKVSVAAALLPLHDPIRLAEQIATIDCLAPGRLSLVAGAGYRPAEFTMAGIDRKRRGALLEEAVRVFRMAWRGQPFEWRGREMLVTPTPATPEGPEIHVGGKTIAGAQRAARLCCPFSPAVSDPEVIAAYFDECARIGFARPDVFGCASMEEYTRNIASKATAPRVFVMVSEDPDATWKRIGPHVTYDATTYTAWQEEGIVSDNAAPGLETWEQLRDSGRYVVVTPEQCIEMIRSEGHLMLHPLMGGIEPSLAWQSLKLFESRVLPHAL